MQHSCQLDSPQRHKGTQIMFLLSKDGHASTSEPLAMKGWLKHKRVNRFLEWLVKEISRYVVFVRNVSLLSSAVTCSAVCQEHPSVPRISLARHFWNCFAKSKAHAWFLSIGFPSETRRSTNHVFWVETEHACTSEPSCNGRIMKT